MSLAKKLALFVVRLIVVYIIVFILWIILNPYYNHLLGLSCSKLLPAFSSGVINVNSVTYENHAFEYKFVIKPKDLRPWIRKGMRLEQLGVPLIIFLTLMLITPNIAVKRRLKLLLIGILIFFLCYVFLTIVILLGFINSKYPFVAQDNFLGKLFSIRANYKIAGFFLVFGQQFVPVLIWLVVCMKPLSTFGKEVLARRRRSPKRV